MDEQPKQPPRSEGSNSDPGLAILLLRSDRKEIKNTGPQYIDQRQPYEMTCPGRTSAGLPNTRIVLLPVFSNSPIYSPDTEAVDLKSGYKDPPLIKWDKSVGKAHALNASWVCSLSNQEGPDCYFCMVRGGFLPKEPSEELQVRLNKAKKAAGK
jgi:hypothetical protein